MAARTSDSCTGGRSPQAVHEAVRSSVLMLSCTADSDDSMFIIWALDTSNAAAPLCFAAWFPAEQTARESRTSGHAHARTLRQGGAQGANIKLMLAAPGGAQCQASQAIPASAASQAAPAQQSRTVPWPQQSFPQHQHSKRNILQHSMFDGCG
jgi:hypothetical protein